MSTTTTTTLPSNLPNPTIHITTHSPTTGKAHLHSSTQNAWTFLRSSTIGFNVIYTTSQFPASLSSNTDITTHEKVVQSGTLGLVQPHGTVCRIVDFGPQHEPLMHRTQSLDYGVVLEGEIEMELDGGEVKVLRRGDVAVQRGTMHAWRNQSKTEWARMLFVLQDCEPVVVGGERLGEDLGGEVEGLPGSGNAFHKLIKSSLS
ncbi:hypothetical protein VE01_06362 [Pseudogymnoascus verrucosus]|uniref:Cupin type-2 domain-containing protein n=1 Tax=Pseudogymnoascus verrucosus TaxID=342668 RepID=A0A1B8GG06_9PEZI|nr:uncharacterized protein VE01_06362 [Pseudogymnoascus verrucosus]OBT94779.1 hypothetical protein VE01_06362 [Pseudogymnoascus verrucosus]